MCCKEVLKWTIFTTEHNYFKLLEDAVGRSGYETSRFAVATCSIGIKSITVVQVPLELKLIECCAIGFIFPG